MQDRVPFQMFLKCKKVKLTFRYENDCRMDIMCLKIDIGGFFFSKLDSNNISAGPGHHIF